MTVVARHPKWRLLLIAIAGVTGMALVAGCGAGAGTVVAKPPVAKLTFAPGDNASSVNPKAPVKVSVRRGKLDGVTLTNPEGEQVKGRLAADGSSWQATEPLGYGKEYTWHGKATGSDGKQVPVQGSFRTVQPAKVVRATVNPIDHKTVGVGMPISVKFDAPVKDKAAAERTLKVDTSVPVEGSWAWLNDKQVDWRPKNYWPAHTKVTVHANLYGVDYGNGKWGRDDLSSTFTIGREQIVKADATTHQIRVVRDGKTVGTYNASYGKDNDPKSATPNGTYIVMQKDPVTYMTNPRAGYFNLPEKWALRLSNHGEFIHENAANAANIGMRNTSNGCINLDPGRAEHYYHSAIVGDPVEVTGTSVDMQAKSDVYDWIIPWGKWKSMSALNHS